MKKYTIEDIRDLDPCYDPAKVILEDWSGTVIDILKLDNVLAEDRIWVVTRYLSDKQNRLFAVWCARESLNLIDNPDPRSLEACDVAERFALNKASQEDLIAARVEARAATWDAASDNARAVTWDAAWVAAWAVSDAASNAAWAAMVAAREIGRDAKIERLAKALENKEWD